ncbi:MAG: hypothetical protein JW809_11800 [Pirellulales bacterium]|nr:hypothetical protein [Pirellulales bacterium]
MFAGALQSVVAWFLIILSAMLLGFCCGYWIGHGEFVGFEKTFRAMAWLPIVWIGQPSVLIPYAVTAVAVYLPLRIESLWLRIVAVPSTFLAWMIVVAQVVRATSDSKFWQW